MDPVARRHRGPIAGDRASARRAGADNEARTERERESRTPLHDSIELGQPKITELLLASGAYVDIASAAILGRLDSVRELLDADSALANDLSTGLSPPG